MSEHYESVEEATEAYKDIKAGIEPVKSEPEEKPYYKNVDEAISANQEKQAAIAEVETHQRRADTSSKNQQERDSNYTLDPSHAEKISRYESEAKKFNAEYQAFNKVVSQIDMQKLRKEKPAEFAAIKLEISEYETRLQNKHSELLNSVKSIQHGIASQVLEGERSKLLKKAPELASESVQAEVREYLLKSGVTQEEIESTIDHRVVLQAYKAMKHEKRKEAKKDKSFKFKKANKAQVDAKVAQAAARFENTRSMSDLRALMDAKASVKIKPMPKPTRSKSNASNTQSKITQLQSVISKDPNSRKALDAAAEIMSLQRRAANA